MKFIVAESLGGKVEGSFSGMAHISTRAFMYDYLNGLYLGGEHGVWPFALGSYSM